MRESVACRMRGLRHLDSHYGFGAISEMAFAASGLSSGRISGIERSDQAILLEVSGSRGNRRVQGKTLDWKAWTSLGVGSWSDGVLRFEDPATTNPAAFYRVRARRTGRSGKLDVAEHNGRFPVHANAHGSSRTVARISGRILHHEIPFHSSHRPCDRPRVVRSRFKTHERLQTRLRRYRKNRSRRRLLLVR